MGKGKNIHIVICPSGWAVKVAGSSKATKITKTQKEAIDYGRTMAMNQQSELLIHGEDGRIRQKFSYGNDPRSIKG